MRRDWPAICSAPLRGGDSLTPQRMGKGMDHDTDPNGLRAVADRARRLAALVSNVRDRAALEAVARECEDAARQPGAASGLTPEAARLPGLRGVRAG